MPVREPNAPTPLGELEALLTCAQELAARLTADPLIGRLLEAFARLPAPDRKVVLGIIERDGAWCRIVEQTSEVTGITVRANPNASLFLHVVDPSQPPDPEPLQRDVDVIAFGIERFLHLLPILFQEGVYSQWTASARALVRTSDLERRRLVVRLVREVVALIGEVDPQAVE